MNWSSTHVFALLLFLLEIKQSFNLVTRVLTSLPGISSLSSWNHLFVYLLPLDLRVFFPCFRLLQLRKIRASVDVLSPRFDSGGSVTHEWFHSLSSFWLLLDLFGQSFHVRKVEITFLGPNWSLDCLAGLNSVKFAIHRPYFIQICDGSSTRCCRIRVFCVLVNRLLVH